VYGLQLATQTIRSVLRRPELSVVQPNGNYRYEARYNWMAVGKGDGEPLPQSYFAVVIVRPTGEVVTAFPAQGGIYEY
jgi:hypothetical protein